jgi:hypothetical protein
MMFAWTPNLLVLAVMLRQRCVITDNRVLKNLLVTSSVSGARLQHQLAVHSVAGNYCAPI